MAKNQIIENYAEEIDRLNSRVRAVGGGDGANFDINQIYTDIEGLNKTIEHLKKENYKLRQTLQSFGASSEDKQSTHTKKDGEMDNLVDRLQELEHRIKSSPTDLPVGDRNNKQQSRINELENEHHQITRRVIDLEEDAKNFKREIEAQENAKSKIQNNLERLIDDHDTLKNRSLDLLRRNTHIEADNDVLRKEKAALVDNIMSLQKSHQDEINNLRTTLESISEKLYVVGLDSENKQTFSDLETRHTSDRKNWTERNRNLQETCEQLQSETAALESKVEEQHQVIQMYQKIESALNQEQFKLRALEAEYDRLTENYAGIEAERDEALNQIRSLERELHLTREERTKVHGEISTLSRHKDDLHRHKETLDEKVKDYERELSDIKEKLRIAETEKRGHERSVQQLKVDSVRNNDMLKLSKEEIGNLHESLSEKRKEHETIDKDRVFLKKKVERLEDQLFQKEKKFLRDEAEKEVDSEDRLRQLLEENDSLKEEVISTLQSNSSS